MSYRFGFSLIEVLIAFTITSLFLASAYLILQNVLFTMEKGSRRPDALYRISELNYVFKSRKYKLEEKVSRRLGDRDEVCERLVYEGGEFLVCPFKLKDMFGRDYRGDKEYLIIFGDSKLILGR